MVLINRNNSTIYRATRTVSSLLNALKYKSWSNAIEMIATRKSVDAIFVFNARVIGAKQLIKSISRTIRCVRRARE